MTHRALATVAGFAAVLALAACGSGSTGAESGSTQSITAQTPSRSVGQTTQPAAQEIDAPPRIHIADGQCRVHDRR
jgi:ABC-type glycerol-3-phosphate transport system substrate-binding protein